jgi:hypothetical protein
VTARSGIGHMGSGGRVGLVGVEEVGDLWHASAGP